MLSASIRSIFLESFQSHGKTKIELAPEGGLTVITGPTDSGKTAIVRALRLLMYNQPQGSDYIRVGRDKATVAVEMADGTKVARERSRGSVNRYRVTKPGESPTALEGFGTSVPMEVQEATGVRVVSIGETLDLALNLSEQLDGPFLGKSVSGPAKAKILGALAGTEEVDEAQRTLGTDLHRAGQEEKRLVAEVEGLDTKIAEYDYLPALKESIAALEVLIEDARSAQERLSVLGAARTRLDNINTQRAQSLAILAQWSGLHEAGLLFCQAVASQTTVDTLRYHKAALLRLARDGEGWIRIQARWVNLSSAGRYVSQAERQHDEASTLSGLRDSLAVTRSGLEKVRVTLGRWASLDEASKRVYACPEVLAKLRILEQDSNRLFALGEQMAKALAIQSRWANLGDAMVELASVPVKQDQLYLLEGRADSLARNRQSQVVAESSLERHRKALGDAQSQYTDTLVALGQCPLCGSEVDPEKLKGVA